MGGTGLEPVTPSLSSWCHPSRTFALAHLFVRACRSFTALTRRGFAPICTPSRQLVVAPGSTHRAGLAPPRPARGRARETRASHATKAYSHVESGTSGSPWGEVHPPDHVEQLDPRALRLDLLKPRPDGRVLGRVRSAAIQSSASLIRGTALIVSASARFSGQSGYMYAPKIAMLSRTGISAGRFLCSVLVATDAPTHGQLVIVPMSSRRALALRVGRLLERLVGERAEIERRSVSVHARRRLRRDARVDQHRDREVFNQHAVCAA